MTSSLEDLRRQVLRRVRFAHNTLALRNHAIPPEGPFDTALTNGLLAIVANEWPGEEYQSNGRTKAARALLKVIELKGPTTSSINLKVLREGLDLTQGARHGLADDGSRASTRRT